MNFHRCCHAAGDPMVSMEDFETIYDTIPCSAMGVGAFGQKDEERFIIGILSGTHPIMSIHGKVSSEEIHALSEALQNRYDELVVWIKWMPDA